MFRLSNKKALGQELKCKVELLVPGEVLEISYNTDSIGQHIFDDVVKELNLVDKDYYGLKLQDPMQWLDLTKSVLKQTKGLNAIAFKLRFKYYPAEPALLASESTRYYLYLQLRLDLLQGRLKCEPSMSHDTIAYLVACILQSELGDSISNNEENYVSEFKFVPNQTESLELASIRLHQSEDFRGLGPGDCELNFLKKACQLDTYGIDPCPVKEGNSQNHFLIGVNHKGVATFQDSRMVNQFTWAEVNRVTLDNKLVLVYCRKADKNGTKPSRTKALLGFRCPSQAHAFNFWKVANEHRFFFTLESTPETPIVTNTGGLFKKSHKLKYAGRVERDVLKEQAEESRDGGVRRSHSLMSKANDEPRWQVFNSVSNLKSVQNNFYSSDMINKTTPSNLDYFAEEAEGEAEEDQVEDCSSMPYQSPNSGQGVTVFTEQTKKRNSISSLTKNSPKTFTRRQILTKSSDEQQIDPASPTGDTVNEKNHDFMTTTIVLLSIIAVSLFIMLLIGRSDRPASVSLVVEKLNLENVSLALRNNYYLPLKSAMRNIVSQAFSMLDKRIVQT